MNNKVARLKGFTHNIVNGHDLAVVGRAVNYNAEILEKLIERVEKLEKEARNK